MSQPELLTHVTEVLRGLGIEFMLTGSHASSLQGEPRATHDIDLVVRMVSTHIQPLVAAFQSDQFYLSETAVTEAVRSRRMFSLLDLVDGEKVDFWILTETPFDQSRFARRQQINLGGHVVDLSSPEDTILMKLCWSNQSGGSEKQFQDVLRVFELQRDLLNQEYLKSWVKTLGVEDLWHRVVAEAETMDLPEDL